MQLKCRCPVCSHSPSAPDELIHAELTDAGWFEIHCSHGHTANIVLNVPKHELLYELGTLAFIDGYTREAVTSLSTAIERFYEFSIRVLLQPDVVHCEAFAETWKHVANQSERQLGAYYFLYLKRFGRKPSVVPSKWIEFRNKAVHKGYIPSSSEVTDYGDFVFSHLSGLLAQLHKEVEPALAAVQFEDTQACLAAAGNDRAAAFMYVHSLLANPGPGEQQVGSFRQGIQMRREKRWLIPQDVRHVYAFPVE